MTNGTRQSPTPSQGPEGSDLHTVANQIEGLLDADGHFNPNPDEVSRGHPDYDESTDRRTHREQSRDNRGRFQRKAAPAPESGEDETAEQADLEAEDDQQAAPADQEADTEQLDAGDTDEDRAESATEEAEESEEEGTAPIRTLTELADALEVPIEDLQADLTHTFRAAGEEVTVNLSELVAGYQKDADYRRQTGELANARRQAEQDYQQRMQAFEQQNVQAAHVLNVTEKLLTDEMNSDELAALRTTDPTAWMVRREELGQKVATLQQARQYAAQQYQQFHTQNLQGLKERELKALKERMPDFGRDHVAIARKTMSSLGMSDPEISEVFDHRLVLGALELATLRQEVEQLRNEKAKAKDSVKRVKKTVPKIKRPGKQRLGGKRPLTRDNVARLRQRAAKSGTVQDAAKVIETMFES